MSLADQRDIGIHLLERLGIEDQDRQAELVELLDHRRRCELVAGRQHEVRLRVHDELDVDGRGDDDVIDLGDLGRVVVEVGDARRAGRRRRARRRSRCSTGRG